MVSSGCYVSSSMSIPPRTTLTASRAGVLLALLCLAFTALAAAGLFAPPGAQAAARQVSLTVTPAVFSPNGDGVEDVVRARVKLQIKARLFVGVYGPDGKLVKTLQARRTSRAGTRAYTWTGIRSGDPCGNGAFTIVAKATVGKRTSTARRPVVLDTLAPEVATTDGTQLRLFAGGGSTVAVSYSCDGGPGATVALKVCEPSTGGGMGKVVAQTGAVAAVADGTLSWDGLATSGGVVDNGRYAVYVLATDAVGNSSTSHPVPVVAYGPRAVQGTVTNLTGGPVEGAEVTVAGTDIQVMTDSQGGFSIPACPMGFRVFSATRSGQPAGSVRARVNMDSGPVKIVLGVTASCRERAPVRGTVTISGHLYYLNENSVATPMRGVRVVLQDDATTFYDDLATCTSGQDGSFSFSYDPDEDYWDFWGKADVRVVAYAEDGASDVCAIYDGYLSLDPYEFVATSQWEDNTSSHTGLTCIKSGDDRAAWYIQEKIKDAHDRWRALTGWSRPLIKVEYPVDLNAAGKYWPELDWIDIDEAYQWEGTTAVHEYGHAIMADAYQTSNGASIYEAYLSPSHLCDVWVPARGRWYRYQSDGSYSTLEGESDKWVAMNEGWARFFAAYMYGRDWSGTPGSFECDYSYSAKDDTKVIHSVSRALWDMADAASTPLAATWLDSADPPEIARLSGLYGSGDDDRLSFASGTGSQGILTALWNVLYWDWPASIDELRSYLTPRLDQSGRRAVDAILYRMDIGRGAVVENQPVVGQVVVTDSEQSTGATLHGTLHLWCQATDSDAQDAGFVKTRWEAQRQTPAGTVTSWQPLVWSNEPSTSPPTGHTGTGWYHSTYDTSGPSPVELIPNLTSYGFAAFGSRGLLQTEGRFDAVWVRAIAYDDLAEGTPVVHGPFAIDNGPTTGVTGTITSATTSLPIQGATVELRRGGSSPQGELWGTTTSNSHGTYVFTGMPAGGYTVVAGMSGYASNHVNAAINTGIVTDYRDIALTPLPPTFGGFATNVEGGTSIWWGPWPASGSVPHDATYELRFGSAGIEEGTIAMIPVAYGAATAPIMRLMLLSDGKLSFAVNEAGSGIYGGTWHTITSDSRMVYDRIYHVAVQHGSQGMKLFVDGQLWAGSAYTGWPQQNVVAGSPTSGFSIGDYERLNGPAKGLYDEVRVSHVQRYSGSFTPPAAPFVADAQTDILDHLDGSTTGTNDGFAFASYSARPSTRR